MQSDRLRQLPPYLFVEIDKRKEALAGSGRRVLDLGIGDPDLGAPPELLEEFVRALDRREFHRYPSSTGHPRLVEAIRGWAKKYHGVALEPAEILVTIGSKEAIGHLPLAVVNPGDVVLIPDPGYPVYNSSAIFAGAKIHSMPLEEANGFWPDFASISPSVLDKSKLIYLNYPNNPTSAVTGEEGFREAIELCLDNDVILVNDAAYCEISYEGSAPCLFPTARDSGAAYIELFSFSKTFSITGWRVGYAIGSPEIISALARLKANLDSGVFSAIQEAVAKVVEGEYEKVTGRIMSVLRERRDILTGSLKSGGFSFTIPRATFYFWIRTPEGARSIDFCSRLMDYTGIVATPGIGFGQHGEGYFRLSITTDTDTILEAGKALESYSGRV